MSIPAYLRDEARRSALALSALREQPTSPVGAGGDQQILARLQACLDARALVPGETERARDLAAAAANGVERDAYLWRGEATRRQIGQAARVAEERLRLLDSLKSAEDFRRENERCSADTLHWFRMYAWGYDPRALLKVQPFYPFPRQEEYLVWLDETVLRRRKSGLVEKARDQGATVGALDWVCHKWLFVPGFSAFLSSATEDLVDSKKDPDTLFEKVRFQLRLTPSWMLPDGFSPARDMPYMNIHNPATGATVTGGAPTESVGRQRRATVVLADEFQSWPGGGYKQNTALSQTSDSVIKLGTPLGMQNAYAVEAHTPGANKFEMDWRDHPWKSEAWYASLPFGYIAPVMTPEAIAQEVDRNYHASQPGKVFRAWHEREPYVVITWGELVEYYKQFGLDRHFVDGATGAYRVPRDWNWGRMQDYGQTEAHKWVVTYAARPRANYPLADSVFVFGYVVAPTGAAVGEVQPLIEDRQRRLGLAGEPELSQMSHEAADVRHTFMEEHGEYWRAWDTDYNLGIPQILEWLMLVDQTKPNPIRPALMGRTRLYFVCADEVKLAFNPGAKRHFVTPSKSESSFRLAREEMNGYHYPVEELGKPPGLMRPRKIKDDFIDTLRGFATKWGPSVAPLTEEEEREAKLPAYLRAGEVMSHRGRPEYPQLVAERESALRRAALLEQREREAFSEAWARSQGRPVLHRKYRRWG